MLCSDLRAGAEAAEVRAALAAGGEDWDALARILQDANSCAAMFRRLDRTGPEVIARARTVLSAFTRATLIWSTRLKQLKRWKLSRRNCLLWVAIPPTSSPYGGAPHGRSGSTPPLRASTPGGARRP